MPKRVLIKVMTPFLEASLVKQILIGLVMGVGLAMMAPATATSMGLLGSVFVSALKAVAPILVFVLVMSAIANQDLEA
ncbi:MAG: cation:dicarboxylase symporter family transporter, partial [Burkholderiaceae bacterium]|nr:cation:dicarboxylase symporter family transporter [Burkholderiaceae bacterium]